MQNIVKIQKNDLVVSIQDMADFSGNDYSSVRDLLKRNEGYFEELGLNLPEVVRGSTDFKSVLLNEPQATFLMTLMRNSEVVTKFKLELVMDFYKMRKKLLSINRNSQPQLNVDFNNCNRCPMTLSKYLKTSTLAIDEATAWAKLYDHNKVRNIYPAKVKIILNDFSLGKQRGSAAPKFYAKELDKFFSKIFPTLF